MITAPVPSSTAALAGKYLVVTLGEETHGIPVPLVREIIRAQRVTPLPERSSMLEGVINLRGRVIPIADLRIRFGLPSVYGDTTCFVVVNLPAPRGGIAPLGLVVDSVEEVAQIAASAIEPAPDSIGSAGLSSILGLAKSDGRVMPLLDVSSLYGACSSLAPALG